jgi:hypothetical protein
MECKELAFVHFSTVSQQAAGPLPQIQNVYKQFSMVLSARLVTKATKRIPPKLASELYHLALFHKSESHSPISPRNVGPKAFTGDGKLRLVIGPGNNKSTVERANYAESSGEYQWDALYDAVRNREPLNDNVIEQTILGLKVIKAMVRAETSQKTELVA